MKTPPPNQTGKPLFFWITIACGLFVAIAIACTASLFWRYGTVQHVTGWNYCRKGSGWYIESVDRKGPAAMAVRTGDRIVAIDRNTQVEQAGPFAALRPLNPGDTYSMEIERGGGRSHVRLAMEAASRQPKTWLWCSFLLAAIGFFVAGLLAGITRPGDRLTRICTLAAMAWALQMLNAPLDDLYRPRSGLADSFYFQAHGWEFWICLLIDVFARPWYLVLTFDFLSSFPADAPPGRSGQRCDGRFTDTESSPPRGRSRSPWHSWPATAMRFRC